MLRILIIDDSPFFLKALAELLAFYPGVEVVGQAASGAEGLRLSSTLLPDLVFVDLKMAGLNGLEVAETLKREQPAIRVVIISLHDTAEYRERSAVIGVERFVCKKELFPELASIIGDQFLPPSTAELAP